MGRVRFSNDEPEDGFSKQRALYIFREFVNLDVVVRSRCAKSNGEEETGERERAPFLCLR